MKIVSTFNQANFIQICDRLAGIDVDLEKIIACYGYPPLWKRQPGFATLVHIILEQQVSLASAKAAFAKLEERLKLISPEGLLALSDDELKSCYFSRQKIIYSRILSQAIYDGQLDLDVFEMKSDEEVRATLIKLKGIGSWTADVYLMMALQRSDLFPIGDIALISSIKEHKNLPKDTSKESILQLAASWKPHRTVAAFILWHGYLCKRKRLPVGTVDSVLL